MRNSLTTCLILACALAQANGQTNRSQQKSDQRDRSFVGDQACATCHQALPRSFDKTAHHLTSRVAARDSILGSFENGKNVISTSVPDLSFRMDAKESEFFQTAIEGVEPDVKNHTERFDLVIGSGHIGQSYLYWKEDKLFELPISYWTGIGWGNSPGYRDGVADFDRPIFPRCLECHATKFDSLAPSSNRYGKSQSVAGITCEKCHGPGSEHLRLESSQQRPLSEPAILNPRNFSRDRQMELCAWCHAGQGTSVAPSFSYSPGAQLSDYVQLPESNADGNVDVHGGQLELLKRSRCFRDSAMTCTTCHDVHEQQHDLKMFSQKCLTCHEPGNSAFPKKNHDRQSLCVDCHMPQQSTNMVFVYQDGKRVNPKLRNHWIRVYPVLSGGK